MARAAVLDIDGIEIPCGYGSLMPKKLDRSGRRHLLHYLEDLDLGLAALNADIGFRIGSSEHYELFADRTKEILDLAVELQVPIVTTTIGPIPEVQAEQDSAEADEMPIEGSLVLARELQAVIAQSPIRELSDEEEKDREEDEEQEEETDPGLVRAIVTEIVRDLGNFAANRACRLAISTGHETPEALQQFLDKLDNDGLGINYDPVNMIFAGHDPVESVEPLGRYIVAARARDGRRLLDGAIEEHQLGEGDVPFDEFIEALDDVDFQGYLTITRQPQEDPEDDIEKALEFLERY